MHRQFRGERKVFPTNAAEEIGYHVYTYTQKKNFNPYLILHMKINSKMIADPNEIPKSAKLLKENKDKKYLQPQAKFS